VGRYPDQAMPTRISKPLYDNTAARPREGPHRLAPRLAGCGLVWTDIRAIQCL